MRSLRLRPGHWSGNSPTHRHMHIHKCSQTYTRIQVHTHIRVHTHTHTIMLKGISCTFQPLTVSLINNIPSSLSPATQVTRPSKTSKKAYNQTIPSLCQFSALALLSIDKIMSSPSDFTSPRFIHLRVYPVTGIISGKFTCPR